MAIQTDNLTQAPQEQNFSIENRNFLSPIGFKFSVNKLRGVDFFCQSASIPAMQLASADSYTRFNKIPNPGDEIQYEDLFIKFLIDENMKNWYQVHDWMRELGTPYSSEEFTMSRGTLKSVNKEIKPLKGKISHSGQWEDQWRSDCSLFVLSSNYQPVAEFVFHDAWPTTLSTVNFDASVPDINYFTAEMSMKYTYYDYYIYDAATATDATMTPTYRRSYLGNTI